MLNWIKPGTSLKGDHVDLLPLEEKHFAELNVLAGDKRIWEFTAGKMNTDDIRLNAFKMALEERKRGTQFPFVIFNKGENKIVGSTRFMNIEPAHRKLEIGWTWLHPDYWATTINMECKLLLLTHCFEELKTVRVQLKTDENNIRSRTAIRKIGGQYEGILRHDLIRDNGTLRNSAYFSIIEPEWIDVKRNIGIQIIENKKGVKTKFKIEFENFIIRELEQGDAEPFYQFIERNRNRIAPSAPVSVKTVVDPESAKTFIRQRNELARNREKFTYILFTKSDNKPIANLVITNIDWTIPKGEIGYYIDGEYERKGITTRFVNHVCDFAFETLGFNKLFMRIGEENNGSKRVAEKNNFQMEGILHKDYRNGNDELVDVIYYTKLYHSQNKNTKEAR
jgi:RimJ/RimL family protein N-acetyltransferase